MKYHIERQLPNIYKKKLYSEILNKNFKLWISMKARKCIMKAGSLDNYLLNTKPKYIDSKFGLYLRDLIQKKKNNKLSYNDLVYIPGTSN
jgi:large subunit ribosomal protein L28